MPYPFISDVTTLLRVTVNDSFTVNGIPLAGRILNDSNAVIIPLLNLSLSQLQRDLERAGAYQPYKKEVVILAIPVLVGANGAGNPDPTAQQNLNFSGFFNGSAQVAPPPALPNDLLSPVALWNRPNGTALPFNELPPAAGGLQSRYQDATSLGDWEWRGDSIWWNGCLVQQDIKIRYTAGIPKFPMTLQPADFPKTTIPLLDSEQALANYMAYIFCRSRLPPGAAAELLSDYTQAKQGMVSRAVKEKQSSTFERTSPDSEGGVWFGS